MATHGILLRTAARVSAGSEESGRPSRERNNGRCGEAKYAVSEFGVRGQGIGMRREWLWEYDAILQSWVALLLVGTGVGDAQSGLVVRVYGHSAAVVRAVAEAADRNRRCRGQWQHWCQEQPAQQRG